MPPELDGRKSMIARIRGTVVDSGEGSIIVECGGIGYRVKVPEPLIAGVRPNEEVILYTELIVRQDLLQLYGFSSTLQADMFRLLVSVSHIGPQTGLAVLSRLSLAEIREAIIRQKPDVLSKVPGLGKKGAERIILELKSKMDRFAGVSEFPGETSSITEDAILALLSLGFTRDEADRALQQIPEIDRLSSTELVREALRFLKRA